MLHTPRFGTATLFLLDPSLHGRSRDKFLRLKEERHGKDEWDRINTYTLGRGKILVVSGPHLKQARAISDAAKRLVPQPLTVKNLFVGLRRGLDPHKLYHMDKREKAALTRFAKLHAEVIVVDDTAPQVIALIETARQSFLPRLGKGRVPDAMREIVRFFDPKLWEREIQRGKAALQAYEQAKEKFPGH